MFEIFILYPVFKTYIEGRRWFNNEKEIISLGIAGFIYFFFHYFVSSLCWNKKKTQTHEYASIKHYL